MKIRLATLGLLVCLTTITVHAQKKQYITYHTGNGTEITTENPETYVFQRVIQEPDSGKTHYTMMEFYKNKHVRCKAYLIQTENGLDYDGPFQYHDTTGVIKRKFNFEKGLLKGYITTYYPSGKIHKVQLQEKAVDIPVVSYLENFNNDKLPLINYYDSLGVQTMKNGTGYYKEGDEEGPYEGSLKHGVWKGKINGGSYEETYKNGTFTGGVATLADGTKNNYKETEELPQYPGGIDKFRRFVYSRISPDLFSDFKRSTTIRVSFVVEPDGSTSEFTISQNAPKVFTAVKDIWSRAGKWNPGKLHGIPVRIKYSFPLNVEIPQEDPDARFRNERN